MSRYLFAHEEDDLQYPGLRRNPEPESDYNSFRAGMQGHYTRVHWPAAQERMQKGWRIHSPLYGMVMRWGTDEQKQLVKDYVQRQPGGLFGGREKLGGSETKTDEQLQNISVTETQKSEGPVAGGNGVVENIGGEKSQIQSPPAPEQFTYTYQEFEQDALAPERAKINISNALTAPQKEIFQWQEAVSIMREVNKPGTKNYSEEEFLTFVRRSLKEGWMPGKTPVPNAREPRIVGYRNNIPRIEALNYDEAFLFARLSSPPIEKFDALYIIKGWEIKRNSGIELSSREGGLNRKNYEIRAEKGLVIPYKKISELAGDTANYQKLSVYPSDKAKLQSDEFVAMVRGAQMKIGQTPDGILTDELIAFANLPQTSSARKGAGQSDKDPIDIFIAKLYFISGDIDLFRLAMQETTKRPVQTIELQKLARSASEILFPNNFYKPVYPSADFYIAVDEWGEKFKGDERSMDLERIRILANQEYNSLAPQRAKIEAEIKTIQERLANPYRNTNYVQGPNGRVNLNDVSDQLQLNSLKQQLANMELPVLIEKYSSRQTFQTSSNLYHHNISNSKKNWNNLFFPTDNPYAANDSQYFTYGSFSTNNASQKLIIAHQFKETEDEHNQLASQMQQENGQTAAAALAQRETELFNQRIETAKRLAGKTPIVKLWADMNAASINYQAKFSADQVVINVFSGKSITSRESTAVSGISASKNDTDTYDRILEALNTRYNGRDHSPSGQLIAAMYALFYAFKDKANTHILPPLKPGKMEPLSLRKLMLYAGMLFDDYTLPLIGKANLNERMKELNQSMAAMTEIKQTYGNVQLLSNRFLLRQNQQDVAQNNSVSRERRSMIKNGVCMPVYWKSDGNMYQLIVDAGDGDPKIVEFELDKTITDKTQRDTYAIKQLIAKLEQWNGLPQGFLLFTTPDGATHQKNFEKHITLSEVLGWLSIAVFVVGAVFTGGATLGLVSLTAAALSVSSAAVGLYEKSQVGNLTAEDWALGGLTALSSILPAGQLAGKLGTLTKGAGAFFGGNKLYAAVSVVSSATDSVVNGYIMTSDFAASFDELESIKDPKQKEEAKRKLLFMALLNGALTYHALKGDIADLNGLKKLKAQGHLIPDDILLQKKLKPRDALPSQLGDAGVLNETTLAKTALGTGMTDPQTVAAKQNVLTPDKLQTVHYNPAKGYEGWQEKKQQTITLGAKKNELGEIEYSRTDASGKKVLNKEQYEQEIRFGKEVKRQQALSLADIEGRIIDEAGNIDPEKLKEFFNELQAQGVQIMTGKNAEALLKKHNANALYLPGDTPGQPGMIVLRENADKQHIIEEIFHLKQHEQEGFRRLGASEVIDMELDAHVQMLEYARTKGWTKEEIEQLERNKELWEGDKKRYQEDAEFRKKFDEGNGGFKSRKEHITSKIPELFESIDPNDTLEGVTFSDKKRTTKEGYIEITTYVRFNGINEESYFIRQYDPSSNTLIFHHAFLATDPNTNKVNKRHSWIDNKKTPLVEGKGIPTQMYVTMRQMKMMGITTSDIKIVKMSHIQNAETTLFVTKHLDQNKSNDFSIVGNEILKADSVEYAKSTLVQSGFEITGASVSVNPETAKYRILDIKSEFDYNGDLLNKYGYTENDYVYLDFDINLKVNSIK